MEKKRMRKGSETDEGLNQGTDLGMKNGGNLRDHVIKEQEWSR